VRTAPTNDSTRSVPLSTASVLVNVTLADLNDNAPRFQRSVYRLLLDYAGRDVGSDGSGGVLTLLNATDLDVGSPLTNGAVRYVWWGPLAQEAARFFDLSATQGAIRRRVRPQLLRLAKNRDTRYQLRVWDRPESEAERLSDTAELRVTSVAAEDYALRVHLLSGACLSNSSQAEWQRRRLAVASAVEKTLRASSIRDLRLASVILFSLAAAPSVAQTCVNFRFFLHFLYISTFFRQRRLLTASQEERWTVDFLVQTNTSSSNDKDFSMARLNKATGVLPLLVGANGEATAAFLNNLQSGAVNATFVGVTRVDPPAPLATSASVSTGPTPVKRQVATQTDLALLLALCSFAVLL